MKRGERKDSNKDEPGKDSLWWILKISFFAMLLFSVGSLLFLFNRIILYLIGGMLIWIFFLSVVLSLVFFIIRMANKNRGRDFSWWGLRVSLSVLIILAYEAILLTFVFLFPVFFIIVLPLVSILAFLVVYSLKSKKKIISLTVLGVVLVLFLASLFIPFRNSYYTTYYKEACSVQGEQNNYQEWINSAQVYMYHEWINSTQVLDETGKAFDVGKQIQLCMNTGGCYTNCGSSCPPSQKLTAIGFLDEQMMACTMDCHLQCVCPFGTTFDSEKGCV